MDRTNQKIVTEACRKGGQSAAELKHRNTGHSKVRDCHLTVLLDLPGGSSCMCPILLTMTDISQERKASYVVISTLGV